MVARAGWMLLVRQSHRQRRCASQETSRGYVKLRCARRCPAPKFRSLCCTLPSVSCGVPSVKSGQNCPLSQVTVPAGCTYLHIYKFHVRLCPAHIFRALHNARYTQRLCSTANHTASLSLFCLLDTLRQP